MNKLWCIFLVCFFFTNSVEAQNAFFKNFTSEQGLPSDKMQCATQGSDGFIWIGTNNGLSRFDGYQFRNYYNYLNNPSSISSDNILQLEPEEAGLLWVGHYEAGIDLFDTKTGKKIFNLNEKSDNNAIPDNRISKIWNEKSKNRIWICTTRNMWVWYDKNLKKIIHPKPSSHLKNKREIPKTNTIYDIFPDPKRPNSYWLATNDGLVLFDEEQNNLLYFNFEKVKTGFNTNDRLRSIVNLDNKLWIASRGGVGLIRFDLKTLKHDFFPVNKTTNSSSLAIKIIPKSTHELWIGTIGKSLGVFNINTNLYTFYNHDPKLQSSIAGGDLIDIYMDNQENTWFLSNKGLSLYSPKYQYFNTVFLPNRIKDSKPISFTDDETNLYIGLSQTNELLIYNKKRNQFESKKLNSSNDNNLNILRIKKDPKGIVWLVAGSELWVYNNFNKNLKKIKLPNAIEGKLLHSIHFNNDNIYLGTRFNGLFKWSIKNNSCDSLQKENGNLVHDRLIHEIIEDDFGRLWVGTERGISVINIQEFKVLKNFGQSDGIKVTYRMASDKKGVLYASSENKGVYAFDTKNLTFLKSITKEQGLPSNAIQHLAIDYKDNLWIATQQGLAKFNKVDAVLQLFTMRSGLLENHLEASLNTLSGTKMIQGFENGFSIFDANLFSDNRNLILPKIINFRVFDEDLPIQKKMILKPNQNYFSLVFSVLDFANADMIKYSYKLEGVNKDWVYPLNQREISYTNIEPGNYVFKVRSAYIGNNNWSDSSEIEIEIKPPFYKTFWFIIIAFCAISGLAFYFYNFKINQIKNDERIKNELNKQLMASEMRALRSQMNPHFLYNCLNSIKYYIIKNQPEEASIYLNKFSKLIRKILTNSQTEFISLNEEIETLELYMEMEKLRFGEKLNFNIVKDENLEIHFLKIPTMLIQPYIENAIWHGIMHKHNEVGKLLLKIEEYKHDFVKITVEDNGIGRKKAAELKSKSLNKTKSLGMEMTKHRIANINAVHDSKISSKTTDLYDENKVANGTRVEIIFKAMTIN